ncbi:MAG TPA: SURF1 family cytochrome oxidase biogenesis protein [Actinophytocola sp.]|uniref:SURF1 family cytochrome oxidase biogenesis protein n=1 Tax=Actinophytocola sp. TaxID=1872138 RepID=UPI002DB971D5|nr:SURF1 family cytochrome oxidase biogenesis protein [Actinophytocola sp.]HEU5471143.1 SURF1 family cytochrome oxidase biogenesis protein [Actinophytocola sp.]
MRLRFLLHPGWLVVTLVVLTFATACYTLLAPWQFRRHDERSATNAAVRASFTAAPVPVGALGPDGQWRQVTLTGTYLPEGETLARLRTVLGEPAFEVLTPFRLTDGSVVLVDRGFVRPDGRSQVAGYPAAPSGRVELLARARADETDPEHRPAFADATNGGRRQVYAVDSRTVAAATGLPIRPGYVQLEAGSPGVLGALPLPELTAGPFLSYALQWIAFGTMAMLAWLYFTWREIKPGGVLATERPQRRTVAQRIAEDEAAERAAAGPA